MKKLGQGRHRAAIDEPDPFSATPEDYYNEQEHALAKLDPAWAKAALYFRTGEHFGHAEGQRRMQTLHRIHDQLEVYRARLAEGDTMAILQAIAVCSQENLPLPTWLATSYSAALSRFLNVGGAPSLDQVFVSPVLPTDTPTKADIARRDWANGVRMWGDLWELVHKDDSVLTVHAAFKKLLATGRYAYARTKAKELVNMVEKSQLQHLGHNITLSRFLEIRRKAFPSR